MLLLFRSRARSPTPSERSFFDVSSSSKSDEFHSGALSATPTRCRRDYFATSLMSSSSSSSSLQQTPGAATSSSCLFCRDGARCRYLLFQFESRHKTTQNNLGSQNPKPNPKHIFRGVEKEEEEEDSKLETHTRRRAEIGPHHHHHHYYYYCRYYYPYSNWQTGDATGPLPVLRHSCPAAAYNDNIN